MASTPLTDSTCLPSIFHTNVFPKQRLCPTGQEETKGPVRHKDIPPYLPVKDGPTTKESTHPTLPAESNAYLANWSKMVLNPPTYPR